jgi:hypothetical protein
MTITLFIPLPSNINEGDTAIFNWLRDTDLVKSTVWTGPNYEYLTFIEPTDATAFTLRFPGKYATVQAPPS